ncbi:MAG: hypothetical protein QM640_09790 [Niabella sp.]
MQKISRLFLIIVLIAVCMGCTKELSNGPGTYTVVSYNLNIAGTDASGLAYLIVHSDSTLYYDVYFSELPDGITPSSFSIIKKKSNTPDTIVQIIQPSIFSSNESVGSVKASVDLLKRMISRSDSLFFRVDNSGAEEIAEGFMTYSW